MADLILRNIDDEIVQALNAYADQMGISVEAAHREILKQFLLQPERKSFVEVSQEIPDVGEDADFERVQDKEAQMKILKLFGKIEYYDDHVNSGFK